MHVLNKIHIYQEKQWSSTYFQTTNKTSGKHLLVQKPSAQIRGFCKNKKKIKKRRKRARSDLPRPDPHVFTGRPSLCSASQELFLVTWRSEGGKVRSSYLNYRREKTTFHREIDGYSVSIGSRFPPSCSRCTQVKWVLGRYFMPHSPTPNLPQARAAHALYSHYCALWATPTLIGTTGHGIKDAAPHPCPWCDLLWLVYVVVGNTNKGLWCKEFREPLLLLQ